MFQTLRSWKEITMALRWRSSFRCNIKEIDLQHSKLFEISSKLNILEPICVKIDFEDEILEVINELKEYTIYHFDYEEKLMEKFKYKDYDEHRCEHQTFIAKVQEMQEDCSNFNRPEIIRNITEFLTGWITAHILETDMKYTEFFNSRGIY
jgi:hemerythrin